MFPALARALTLKLGEDLARQTVPENKGQDIYSAGNFFICSLA